MITVVGAAIVRAGCVLAARRSYPPAEAGRWEFPGGKVTDGESADAALVREVTEELGCSVRVTEWLPGVVRRDSGAGEITLRVGVCRLIAGEPRGAEHDALRWLTPEELDDVDWLEPDRPFLPRLRELLLDGQRLPGGNVGGAVRIGATMRRPTGPWTPAVHALLGRLAEHGLAAVPRVRGLDARGREVLDYLPGEVIDVDAQALNPARLAALGRWLRDLHVAAAGFEHSGPWRFFGADAPTLITHNDVAPYNVAFDGDRVAGVFDWDLAGPSTPLLDLGHTAWTAVPFFRALPAPEAAARLRTFAEAYGAEPAIVLAAVEPRVRLAIDGIREAVRRGDQGMANLAALGEPERTERALADFVERRDAVHALLQSSIPAPNQREPPKAGSPAGPAAQPLRTGERVGHLALIGTRQRIVPLAHLGAHVPHPELPHDAATAQVDRHGLRRHSFQAEGAETVPEHRSGSLGGQSTAPVFPAEPPADIGRRRRALVGEPRRGVPPTEEHVVREAGPETESQPVGRGVGAHRCPVFPRLFGRPGATQDEPHHLRVRVQVDQQRKVLRTQRRQPDPGRHQGRSHPTGLPERDPW